MSLDPHLIGLAVLAAIGTLLMAIVLVVTYLHHTGKKRRK